jgi:hypothetical protein
MRKPVTYNSTDEVLQAAAASYRKAVWANLNERVEIWIEKDALAGVVMPVTAEYDVPLMVTRGYSSETFAYEAAEEINHHFWRGNKGTYVYYLGDWDPSGVQSAEALEKKLKEHATPAAFQFERLALLPDQVYGPPKLPTRRIKDKDTRTESFRRKFAVNECAELDALPADELRT